MGENQNPSKDIRVSPMQLYINVGNENRLRRNFRLSEIAAETLISILSEGTERRRETRSRKLRYKIQTVAETACQLRPPH